MIVAIRGFRQALAAVLGTSGFVHSGRARREKVLEGLLCVSGVLPVDGGGDEVRHPHGGHVLALDVGYRGANAHGEKGSRHWPDETAAALKTWLEPKWLEPKWLRR